MPDALRPCSHLLDHRSYRPLRHLVRKSFQQKDRTRYPGPETVPGLLPLRLALLGLLCQLMS